MIFENVENQNNLNWKSESLFLLLLGKIGNLYFNRMFFYFFMTIYYGDHLLLSDEERVSKQSNPINTENLEQSFRLHLDDQDRLIQKFELFIQENWNSSLLPDMNNSLFYQFANNIVSKNTYSKSKTSKIKNLFTVHNELRDIISQTIDILYPLYIAYIAYRADNVKNISVNNKDGYCQNIIHDFHYVSCDIFVKQPKNNQNVEHDKLDEADFLFGNFVYHNGLDVLNDISIKYNGLLYLKDLNINKSFYEYFDDKNGTSQFFINVIDNSNQIFKHNLSYSPHYIYKQIRLIIQDIYMTSCLNKYNKKLCCAVIHQIFDEFCGKKLVNSLINEIRPYETLLKSEELDGIVYDNFTQHFQSKLLLTSTEINQIIEKINLHDQDYWRCFGNIKHDFLIIDIFKKLSENNYVKDYVFSLLEKLLLDNDFTLLGKHYFSCKNYQFYQFIKPFSEYTKNELNDLTQNNPIFFISDWIDINHPNVYLKNIVNNFYTVNDLMKLNLSYSDLWQKLTNIQINFYQQKKTVSFGLKHSNEINSKNQDKLLDSINYLKLLEKHNIKIHEYVDIDFNLLYQKYNNKDYDQNYFDKLTTKSFNQEIIPPIDSLNGISTYQFFKVIHSFFYPYNGYIVKEPDKSEPIIKNKENHQLDIRPMANFAELYQYLDDQVQKYNNDNSYYIKPIFLKIKSHGLGVSHFLEKFAESKKMPIENVDISSLSTYFDLIGLSATWGNGQTGIFYNIQQKNQNKLSMLYLDNFDQFRNKSDNGNAFSNSYATINKIILKKSRLNYVDEFKLSENEVVDISKIITICIGERFPDVCSKEVIGSFKVFEIDFYKHNDTENPNPILENIWMDVLEEEC